MLRPQRSRRPRRWRPPAEPPPPVSLDAGTIVATPGDGQVTISQGDAPSGGSGPYTRTLYRSTAAGQLGTAVLTFVGTYPFEDTGRTHGTTYYYTLRISDGSAVDDSPQESATPEAPAGSYLPPDLASDDFDNQALGAGLSNPWGGGIDYIFRDGKWWARLYYAPAVGLSHELAVKFTSPAPLRYGATIYSRAEFNLPLSADAETHNRKLLDWQGAGVRMTLNRQGTDLRWSMVDWMGGSEAEIAGSTGIILPSDTEFVIETRMTTNSADGVRDGVLEVWVWVGGVLFAAWSKDTDLGWITENYPGGSYFSGFMTGFQLTIPAGATAYTEHRYVRRIAFSSTRIGP
ncbi:MAG: hypothetical protein AB1941_01885 [Gemmatimonadota bacterium]